MRDREEGEILDLTQRLFDLFILLYIYFRFPRKINSIKINVFTSIFCVFLKKFVPVRIEA